MTMAMMNGHCDDDVHDDNDDNIDNNDVSKMTVIISLIIPL